MAKFASVIMGYLMVMAIIVLVPPAKAQKSDKEPHPEQIVTQTEHPDGSKVTTVYTPGFLDAYPWDKIAAFVVVMTAGLGFVAKWIFRPIMAGENSKQLAVMTTLFPSKAEFEAHKVEDKELRDRVDRLLSPRHPSHNKSV